MTTAPVCVVTNELLEALAAEYVDPAEAKRKASTKPSANGKRKRSGTRPRAGGASPVERARAYLKKIPDSVEGDHGSNPCFYAACLLVMDFGLSEEEAWPLLVEYSETKGHPPWSEAELRHKLDDALKKKAEEPERIGRKLRASPLESNGTAHGDERPTFRGEAMGDAYEGPVDPQAGQESTPPLPAIIGNRRQLRPVTEDAYEAVLRANDPPQLFTRGGVLTRLKILESGRLLLDPLTNHALRGILGRVADWFVLKDSRDGTVEEEEDAPPMEVVHDLANLPAYQSIPTIRKVVEAPAFDRHGAIINAPGWHRDAGVWYQPAPGLVIPGVPARPTPEDVRRAKELLLRELMGDFPFVDQAGRAHALGALLLPFIRDLIDGPTPLHLYGAPVEGTGKGLLVDVTTFVATGRPAEVIPEAQDDAEWRKRLTATLAEAPAYVVLDNLNRLLDSGALSAALTARTWKDRLLGVSKMAVLPVECVWMASGNNVKMSRELARRTISIRIDAKTDAPWERTEFRHKNLLRWAKENRGELAWACLVLCQTWVAAGMPLGEEVLGSFESWAGVMGGILRVAEVPGLLANAKKFREASADQGSEWREFVGYWWNLYREIPVAVKELFDLAQEHYLLEQVRGDGEERGQRTRMGMMLGKVVDRVFGAYRIVHAKVDNCNRQVYKLEPVAQEATGPSPGKGETWPTENNGGPDF